jgi:hypothetical protein
VGVTLEAREQLFGWLAVPYDDKPAWPLRLRRAREQLDKRALSLARGGRDHFRK